MERLLAAPPEVLATLGRGFAAVGRDRRHSAPAAMATWPTAVQALAHGLYAAQAAAGVPGLRALISGPWLFRNVTPCL